MQDISKQIIKELNTNLDSQEKIRKELLSVHNGKLIIKKRNNKAYYYYQYRDGKKVISKYVGIIGSGKVEKYLDERNKYMDLKSDLYDLEQEEKKLKRLLKSLNINSYRTIYTLYEIKKLLKPIIKKYKIDKVYLFGSYSRGEATKNSDLDFLIGHMKNGDSFGLKEDIEKTFGKSVDLIFPDSYSPKIFINEIEKDKVLVS